MFTELIGCNFLQKCFFFVASFVVKPKGYRGTSPLPPNACGRRKSMRAFGDDAEIRPFCRCFFVISLPSFRLAEMAAVARPHLHLETRKAIVSHLIAQEREDDPTDAEERNEWKRSIRANGLLLRSALLCRSTAPFVRAALIDGELEYARKKGACWELRIGPKEERRVFVLPFEHLLGVLRLVGVPNRFQLTLTRAPSDDHFMMHPRPELFVRLLMLLRGLLRFKLDDDCEEDPPCSHVMLAFRLLGPGLKHFEGPPRLLDCTTGLNALDLDSYVCTERTPSGGFLSSLSGHSIKHLDLSKVAEDPLKKAIQLLSPEKDGNESEVQIRNLPTVKTLALTHKFDTRYALLNRLPALKMIFSNVTHCDLQLQVNDETTPDDVHSFLRRLLENAELFSGEFSLGEHLRLNVEGNVEYRAPECAVSSAWKQMVKERWPQAEVRIEKTTLGFGACVFSKGETLHARIRQPASSLCFQLFFEESASDDEDAYDGWMNRGGGDSDSD
ncbi:hypothetical protein M3Y99_01239600 [Aphelenchoides fujianensis]|nr:hypothetical protein M3Y99_01239600 [Aphelenchoides fujianensis]